MALQVTGKVYSVGQTVSIPAKNGQPFLKRELVLDITRFDPYTGERSQYENFPMFEFSGDKCKELDGLKTGQVVTVSFELQGAFFKGQDGKDKNFTRVRAYKVEVRQSQQPQPQQQQVQQAQQPQYQQAPPPPMEEQLPWTI